MKGLMENIIEKDAYYDLPLGGTVINRFMVDNRFILQFLDIEDPMDIIIGSKFFIDFEKDKKAFDIEDVDTLGPAFKLFYKKIEYGRAYKNGDLEIKFKEGVLLTVPFGEKYEAWELTTNSGAHMISLPSGDLAIFK